MRCMCALLVLAGCGGSEASSPPVTSATSEPIAEVALPEAIDVCVEEDGALTAQTVTSGRAGTYDPTVPIDPTILNWFVAGSYCVSYPGSSTRRAVCGTRATDAPVVTRVLCQQ